MQKYVSYDFLLKMRRIKPTLAHPCPWACDSLHLWRSLCAIAFALLLWPFATSAQTTTVSPGFTEAEFNEHFQLFIDSEQVWQSQGLEKLSSEPRFVPYHKRFLKIRNNFPVVLQFNFRTENIAPGQYIFDFQHADIDSLQVHLSDNLGNRFISTVLGDALPFAQRYRQYRFFAVPLALQPHRDYKLCVALHKPHSFITTKIALATSARWENRVIRSNVVNGLTLGLFFSFIIIGLVMFLVLSQRIYIFYSAYAIAVFLILFSINGYSYQFLFPGLPQLQQYFMILVQLFGLIFLNLYAFELTGLYAHSRFFRLCRNGMVAAYLLFIGITLLLFLRVITVNALLSNLLLGSELVNFIFLLLVPGWFYAKTRQPGALAFSVSFLVVGLSMLYSAFSFLIPGLPYYLLVELLAYGLFAEMLLLSLYMIYSYKKVLHVKMQAELELASERLKNQEAFIQGQEDEKKSIALFLHDHIGSQLTIIMNQLKKIMPGKEQPHSGPDIAEMEKNIRHVSSELRHLSHQLLPVSLDTLALPEALRQLMMDHEADFATRFYTQDVPESLPEYLRLHIYRIVQELLKNAVQHAQATEVFVQLIGYDDCLELHYEDNGKGLQKVNWKKGMGFRSLEFRAQLLKARYTVESLPHKGLLLLMEIPL
jgi:signal transduction histidine kinase